MASPVSIGDALLLSKLAYKLARALTSDRKGVLTAVKENQLFAIGSALRFCCHQEVTDGSADESCPDHLFDGDTQFTEMITNCTKSLQNLETLIHKYGCLKEDDGSSTKGKFSKKATSKLKWIKFLLDDGDFQKIKRDLATHVGAITLALCARTQSVAAIFGVLIAMLICQL